VKPGLSRRELLVRGTKLGALGVLASGVVGPGSWLRPGKALASSLALDEVTLVAALRRMIPKDNPGDWDAVDAGALDYIKQLLGTDLENGSVGIFAGGPLACDFPNFQTLSAVKREGWKVEIDRLRGVYQAGLQELDARSGGVGFKNLPPELQDAVLTSLDLENSPFFRALYDHTMEGVYGHPVYGGNPNFVSWDRLKYQGDVHGARFPSTTGSEPWNVFGGYRPDEIGNPGPEPQLKRASCS
jgi:gluconate 2-dehydrogenase subunit 3-like protein